MNAGHACSSHPVITAVAVAIARGETARSDSAPRRSHYSPSAPPGTGHKVAPHSPTLCLFSIATIPALTTPTCTNRVTGATYAVNELIDPGVHSPPTVDSEIDPEDLAYDLASLHKPRPHADTGDVGAMLLGAIMRRSDPDEWVAAVDAERLDLP